MLVLGLLINSPTLNTGSDTFRFELKPAYKCARKTEAKYLQGPPSVESVTGGAQAIVTR